MNYIYTDGCNADFRKLCNALDSYLNRIVGGVENRQQYLTYNYADEIKDVILVYDNDKVIGCAGFKYYKDEIAELKRVFIKIEYRGKGYSKKLLKLIEDYAREKGYKKIILETGLPLIEAMNLYKTMGYNIIENYEPYKDMKESICMAKDL